MLKTCQKNEEFIMSLLFLLSFISSFGVILVWSARLLPLDYLFLRGAHSASALTPKWWLHIYLYCLGQPYVPQKLNVYWIFSVV